MIDRISGFEFDNLFFIDNYLKIVSRTWLEVNDSCKIYKLLKDFCIIPYASSEILILFNNVPL